MCPVHTLLSHHLEVIVIIKKTKLKGSCFEIREYTHKAINPGKNVRDLISGGRGEKARPNIPLPTVPI